MKNKMRRIIYLDGGLVSGVTGFDPGEVFDVVDYDTDGATADDVCKCKAGRQDDGKNAEHYHNKGHKANAKGEW